MVQHNPTSPDVAQIENTARAGLNHAAMYAAGALYVPGEARARLVGEILALREADVPVVPAFTKAQIVAAMDAADGDLDRALYLLDGCES